MTQLFHGIGDFSFFVQRRFQHQRSRDTLNSIEDEAVCSIGLLSRLDYDIADENVADSSRERRLSISPRFEVVALPRTRRVCYRARGEEAEGAPQSGERRVTRLRLSREH